ncbi:MAG: sodium:calcium antiporter [Syntrophorhabdaceae bacterium]
MRTGIGFLLCTGLIVYSGIGLSKYADVLAEKTRLGRSWTGFVLLAMITSLPELITGVSAAIEQLPDIAVGNVTGSCVFNLFTLALIDLGRKKSISSQAHHGHIISGGFGIILLTLISLSLFLGDRLKSFGWIGPYSLVFFSLYVVAMRLMYNYEHRQVTEFLEDVAEGLKYREMKFSKALIRFGFHSLVVVVAAMFLPGLAAELAEMTGLGQTFVSNIFLTIATALPELVVSFAAVRMGSIDLAVGNLLGSNIFNIVILGIDDLFFKPGPILEFAHLNNVIPALFAITMTAVTIVGITYRAEHKRLFVSWNSLIIISIYLLNVLILYLLAAN